MLLLPPPVGPLPCSSLRPLCPFTGPSWSLSPAVCIEEGQALLFSDGFSFSAPSILLPSYQQVLRDFILHSTRNLGSHCKQWGSVPIWGGSVLSVCLLCSVGFGAAEGRLGWGQLSLAALRASPRLRLTRGFPLKGPEP